MQYLAKVFKINREAKFIQMAEKSGERGPGCTVEGKGQTQWNERKNEA